MYVVRYRTIFVSQHFSFLKATTFKIKLIGSFIKNNWDKYIPLVVEGSNSSNYILM